MRKQLLISLCAMSLFTLGCKDPVVKNEMEKAADHVKEGAHEAAEAARATGRAAEAAGHEIVDDAKAEGEHIKSTVGSTTPETPPAGK